MNAVTLAYGMTLGGREGAKKALAVRHDVEPLYLALMKLIGGASAGLGLLGLYVTFVPLRAGARGAATALALTYAIPILMAAYVAETLAKLTGAPTSWHIMGVLLAIAAGAWVSNAFGRTRGAHPNSPMSA
jgi:hypothetical protein